VGEISEAEQRSIVVTQSGRIRFMVSSSVFKPQCVKGDWCRKSRPNFAHFDPPCKIYEKSRRNIWVNFTSSAYDQTCGILVTGRLSVVWKIRAWCQKGQRQNM